MMLDPVYECCGPVAYSSHPEISEYTSSNATHDTSILDLGRLGIAVHLRQFDVGGRPHSLRQSRVSDDVSESLPVVRASV
jgi:hypothetical protein